VYIINESKSERSLELSENYPTIQTGSFSLYKYKNNKKIQLTVSAHQFIQIELNDDNKKRT